MEEVLVALLVCAATVVGLLVGARIQARRDARRMAIAPAGWREMWVPGSLLVLVLAFLALMMAMGIDRMRQWSDRDELFVRRPVEEVRITDAVEGDAEAAWTVTRGSGNPRLRVQPTPGQGKGMALLVTVDLSGPGDTVAVQRSGDDLPHGFDIATVRIYLADSEAERRAGLHATLVARMNAGSNGSFSVVGERTPLVPGRWTEVVWTGSYTIELSPAMGGDSIDKRVRASDRLTSLAVRLEADEPFRGSVSIDDLRTYPAATPSREDRE